MACDVYLDDVTWWNCNGRHKYVLDFDLVGNGWMGMSMDRREMGCI